MSQLDAEAAEAESPFFFTFARWVRHAEATMGFSGLQRRLRDELPTLRQDHLELLRGELRDLVALATEELERRRTAAGEEP